MDTPAATRGCGQSRGGQRGLAGSASSQVPRPDRGGRERAEEEDTRCGHDRMSGSVRELATTLQRHSFHRTSQTNVKSLAAQRLTGHCLG